MINNFWQKLGFWPKGLINKWKTRKDWVWFHAVSVGELNAVWPLILEIHAIKPSYPIMISCTTKAGYKLAVELTKDKDILVFYFPFDIPLTVKSLLNYAKVKLFVIVETEIWPNIIKECSKRKIPVVLINARLSDKSFKNYLALKFYFKNIVNLFSEILAQSENDANKFIKLGAKSTSVKVMGNIKFTSLPFLQDKPNGNKLWQNDKDVIKIIFASTHPDEEEIALEILKKLLTEFKNIRLIIAPRHTDRTNQIISLVKYFGFNAALKTEDRTIKSENEVFILNTIGELQNYYRQCKITVLGGTFAKVGGHNILEPIKAESYTIIGPYDFKIKELSNLFKINNAIVQVNNTKELYIKIKEAILNEDLRNKRISNGIRIINENSNVLEQTCKHVLAYL